ncbi:tyrosine-type recombinase/integrase [Methylobacterium oryzisoli]
MAHAINRLTARKVANLDAPGRHADGGGLYLNVTASGAKSWVLLYRMGGKRHEMGLGSVNAVPLVKARELAAEAREKIATGTNPLHEKRASPPPAVPTKAVTFADVALAYMADRETTWRNAAHRAQWRQTLEVQAAPIWSAPVATISTADVLDVLRPMWSTKTETARRIRGRIERVIDAARAAGHRAGENPARWRGHLDVLLPRPRKLMRGHHAAMPRDRIAGFYAYLCYRTEPSAYALRLTILTAARSGEVRGMTWGEVDLAEALWIVPAARMKGHREHRVPLSAEALAILRAVRPDEPGAADLVFPSRVGTKLSDMVFLMLLRRAGMGEYTAHGFRSTFRDWVHEDTAFSGDLAEAALAHLVGDETERAYRRGDALEKRRHLMDAWANFVCADRGAPSTSAIRSL